MIFTLFPDYFSRQAKRRQARKEIKTKRRQARKETKTKRRQTLPQGGKREKRETAFPIRSPLAII